MPKHIIVLGTCHEIQGLERFGGVKIDDPDYQKVLALLVESKKIQFIFEEGCGLGPSAAEHTASRKGLGYLDIDPAREEREKLGIPVDTFDHWPVDLLGGSQEAIYWHDLKGHETREEVWLQRIREQRFEGALLVCGLSHMLSMSFRLVAVGFGVEPVVYEPRRRICEGLRQAGFA